MIIIYLFYCIKIFGQDNVILSCPFSLYIDK
nr:MAG TPA: hypothetical protein [Caudoviricetes sp.]